MGIEIERKFLVKQEIWEALPSSNGLRCIQTYLTTDINKTIRVRVMGEKAFITIKGKTNHLSRQEFEYEIPVNEGEELIAQFGEKKLSKVRYLIPHEGHTWEVDIFEGDNEGLMVAEIELSSETENFVKPAWIGEEVSLDSRYYNACLQDNPYVNWK